MHPRESGKMGRTSDGRIGADGEDYQQLADEPETGGSERDAEETGDAAGDVRRHGGRHRRVPRIKADPDSVLVRAMQAARQYGVPYTTLRDLALRGQIPVVRLGKAWYFDRRDLARFIERTKETLGR